MELKEKLKKMGVKSGLRKLSGGANLTHPKLTPWGVAGIAMAVIAILVGIEVGRYLLGKGKGVVGMSTPGPAGKGDLRARLGI